MRIVLDVANVFSRQLRLRGQEMWRLCGRAQHQTTKGRLPAIAAVATIATAPAAAAPPTSAAPPTIAAAAPPASTPLSLGTRFIDYQVSPAKVLTIQRIDRAISFFIVVDLDEGKTARLPCETVTNQIHARGGNSCLRKPLLKLLLRRRKRKIADIELLHLSRLLSGT